MRCQVVSDDACTLTASAAASTMKTVVGGADAPKKLA